MFEFFDVTIELPPALQFLGNTPLRSVILTVVAALLAAALLYLLVYVIIHRFARRTHTDLDDVLLRVSRSSLLWLFFVMGVRDTLDIASLQMGVENALHRFLTAVIIAIIAHWIWKVFKNVIIYHAREMTLRTETRVDDILLPVVDRLVPILIFGVGGAVVLQFLGVRVEAIFAAIGGIAFIIGFALQDSLSNIFAGIILLVDAPFKYGDLLTIGDRVLRVERIGLRTTHLYHVGTHATIIMPNNQVVNRELVNLTRPTPALVSPIRIILPLDVDVRRVLSILQEVANGHPHVLGDVHTKLNASRQRLHRLAQRACWAEARDLMGEIVRLEWEQRLNTLLEELTSRPEALAEMIESREAGGLDAQEKAEIAAGLDDVESHMVELQDVITQWLMMVRYTFVQPAEKLPDDLAAFEKHARDYEQAAQEAVAARRIVRVGNIRLGRGAYDLVMADLETIMHRHGFAGLDRGFPDIDLRNEFMELARDWNRKIRYLSRRLESIRTALKDGDERRLDDMVLEWRDWLYGGLKETTPEWKYPEALFDGFDKLSTFFVLEMYVDDIRRDHFEQVQQVTSEVRREIVDRLREEGIMPAMVTPMPPQSKKTN